MTEDENSSNEEQGSDGDHDTEEDTHQIPELSLDAVLDILSQRERRYILNYLVDSSTEVVPIDEVVKQIVRSETERLDEMPNRDHLELSLYHIHLPKLTDAGLLEYDSQSQQIRYWGNEQVEKWLERIQREEHQS